ncbi:hypothetical protein ACQKJZ_05145 [Sphingomonas sp. NPDC019816]|uniref:hypothetical protein n=1 Tax=Sphingomonas sp. NPDC019816 TaxID=3390679 RepID=UPI003CFFA4D8
MNLVEKAEARSRGRAIVFYLLSVALLASTILSVANGHDEPNRLLPWFVMIGASALNLTGLPFRWSRCGPIARLMNDETTRDHRRSSFEAGFWAMILSTASMTAIWNAVPFSAVIMGRVAITAGLIAALTSFATLELRASR